MANVKNITKKLVGLGFSEDKLMMMTEKEIRDAYKIAKEESIMAKSVITNQKELVNKLSKIIKAYDPYTAYIDDCRKYSNATERNCELDQQFIHTCKEYGYDVHVSFCYSLAKSFSSGKFDSAEDVVIDYINSLEEENMKTSADTTVTNNSTTTLKEESIMNNNTNNTAIIDNATNKEESTMKTREFTLETLVQVLKDNQKVQDAEYIKKDDLRVILKQQFELGFNNRTTRTEMINVVMSMYKDSLRAADEIAYGNVTEDNNVVVGDLDITHDNAPESIEEETKVELTDELSLKILEGIIRQADTNKAHNFISHHMLTSVISGIIVGLPLKEKVNGVMIEHWKTFTDEQKNNIAKIREAFIQKANLIAKHNATNISGYYIPAKILVWGRHVYLGVACVYRFISNNRTLAEYHVSLNGIKNVATGDITALDDVAYKTLDTRCVFVM